MNIINIISMKLRQFLLNCRAKKEEKARLKKYPDYKGETEYDCGEYIFVWGVKAPHEVCEEPASLHTMNDIDLLYSREKKQYTLIVETGIWFDDKEQEIKHLTLLLDDFTKYMEENNLPTNSPYKFWMSQPYLLFDGATISEVYTSFRIFVEGYKAVHQPIGTNLNNEI